MKSKYVSDKPKQQNPWKETQLSETHLTNCVSPLLQQLRLVRSSSEVERVILSDLKDGVYTLTYAVSRRKED